jgi:hypothetical protein
MLAVAYTACNYMKAYFTSACNNRYTTSQYINANSKLTEAAYQLQFYDNVANASAQLFADQLTFSLVNNASFFLGFLKDGNIGGMSTATNVSNTLGSGITFLSPPPPPPSPFPPPSPPSPPPPSPAPPPFCVCVDGWSGVDCSIPPPNV